MTVTELVPADPLTGDLLAVLHARSFAEAWPPAAFRALLEIPGTLALVALAEGEPAGFVLARCVLDEAEIISLGVLPPRRRQGHAGALMAAVAERARATGVRSLFLEVEADNVAARDLYEGLGFVRVGQRRAYYSRPGAAAADALLLRLALAPLDGRATADDDGVDT